MTVDMTEESRADTKLVASLGSKHFEIIPDKSEVGFYIYVYEDGRCTHDYLQDSLELAKSFAEEEFGVPLQSWRQS